MAFVRSIRECLELHKQLVNTPDVIGELREERTELEEMICGGEELPRLREAETRLDKLWHLVNDMATYLRGGTPAPARAVAAAAAPASTFVPKPTEPRPQSGNGLITTAELIKRSGHSRAWVMERFRRKELPEPVQRGRPGISSMYDEAAVDAALAKLKGEG